jgi:serpin B
MIRQNSFRFKQLVLVIFVVALLVVLLPATPVYACSCLPPGAPLAEMAQATAVFAGRVTHIKAPAGAIISSADPVTVTFAVSHVWKGPEESEISLTTARQSASCGFPFQEGQEYLVYAGGSAANLSTHLCTRTTSLAHAGEDLAALGEGQAPPPAAQATSTVPAPVEADSPAVTWWWGVSLILLAALLSGILYLVWHGRGRSRSPMLWLLLPLLVPLLSAGCAPTTPTPEAQPPAQQTAEAITPEPETPEPQTPQMETPEPQTPETPPPPAAPPMAVSHVARETAPDAGAAEVQRLVEGNSAFALDLYHELRREEDGNLFYSPYSISIALAMIYAGARAETEQQMAQTLHYGPDQAGLHPAFNALDRQLTAPGADADAFRLSIANSVWGQEGFPWREDYLDTLARNYGAGLRLVDFSGGTGREEARQAINSWVEDETEGRIEDLIPRGILTELTRLVLANAIYFKGEWEIPFDESIRDGDFYLLDGRPVTVPMMSRRTGSRLAAGDGYQAVELTYKGDRAHMILLLPEPGHFETFEQALTAELLEQIVAGLARTDLMLTMPKFTFETELSLRPTLAAMGMPHAFDEMAADFTGIYDRSQEPRNLFISHVVHKAFVAVDELGTEAAAATGVVAGIVSEPQNNIIVDRPFLFVIRDRESGTLLFVGRVLDPS